jgi:hypothetical protein
MQRYTIYLHLEITLHVSSGTSTHLQERIHLYLQHLVFVTPLLLSAAIVEELEQVWKCCGWRTSPTACINVSSYITCRRHYVVIFLYHKMAGKHVFSKRSVAVLVLVLRLELESKHKLWSCKWGCFDLLLVVFFRLNWVVVCAPDDEWKYHSKHVDQFSDINKMFKVVFIGYTSILG